MRRVNKFINCDELDPHAIGHTENKKEPIVIDQATFAWSKDEEPILKNISLQVKRHKLVAVVGQVSSIYKIGKYFYFNDLIFILFSFPGWSWKIVIIISASR